MLRRVETVGATQGLPFLRRLSAKARVLLPRTQEIKLAARRHLVPFRCSGGGQTATVPFGISESSRSSSVAW